MATMDLSVIHQNQKGGHFAEDYGNKLSKIKENIQETDVKRNNNLFNSSKTETISDLRHNPDSLFQDVTYISQESLKVENTIFSYASFQKAMDLSMHCRSNGETKRTIFEDADYFSKNYLYKLLPITFENVDEAIIHTEHNYCHASLSSESEIDEDCSRTMDYSQIKEKNYKKRKTKNDQSAEEDALENPEGQDQNSLPLNFSSPTNSVPEAEQKDSNTSIRSEEKPTLSQPLDLSAPLVQEKKTDVCLRLREPSIVSSNTTEKEDGGEFDSDKENQKSSSRCIEVTITRPDEKENYEPCDLFLNDIARLVPKLIKKDCFEIEILDRTFDHKVDSQKHRLYYIISQTTWQLFRSANERVILTNDQSLGQPLQRTEENEKPTFIIFDQMSLAKCLADYCKEIGGSFEYTCVEESKDEGDLKMSEESEKIDVDVKEKKIEKGEGMPEESPCTEGEIKKAEEKKKEEKCDAKVKDDDVKSKKTVDKWINANAIVDCRVIIEKLIIDCCLINEKRKREGREGLRGSKKIKTEASMSEKKPTINKEINVKGGAIKKTQDSEVREIKTRLKSVQNVKIETSQKSNKVVEKKETGTKRKAEKPVETPKKPKQSPASEISSERKTRSGKILEEVSQTKVEMVTESKKEVAKEANKERRSLRSVKKEEEKNKDLIGAKKKDSMDVKKDEVRKNPVSVKKEDVKKKVVESVKKVEVKSKNIENVKKEDGKRKDSENVQKEVLRRPETRQSTGKSLGLRSRTSSQKEVVAKIPKSVPKTSSKGRKR